MWSACADSSGARAWMTSVASPCSSPPREATISPSCRATARVALAGRVQRPDHLVGDVVLGIDVDGFLQDQVVLLLLRHLLDHAVGAVQHLLQFLVLARVQVFLEFAPLALELAVLVDQRLLALATLGLRQGGRLPLEALRGGLQRRAHVIELLLAARELLFALQIG